MPRSTHSKKESLRSRMLRLSIGLTLLCLSLSACLSERVVYRDRLIDVAMVMPVDQPYSEYRKNEELVALIFEYEAALKVCNKRLQDAREWGRND